MCACVVFDDEVSQGSIPMTQQAMSAVKLLTRSGGSSTLQHLSALKDTQLIVKCSKLIRSHIGVVTDTPNTL